MIYCIIAAHPDDEVLGCGGSMAKWASAGHDVHVLIMAEGATSRDDRRNRKLRHKEISNLAQSAKRARDILGVKSVELLNYPDNRMDSLDILELVKAVEMKLEKLKPDIIVTHHGGDLNVDHRIVHQAVITACRPEPGKSVKQILSFEVVSSTEWQSPDDRRSFIPNWYEDISATLSIKLKALEAYESEMRTWPHARSLKAVRHLARWRGASIGCKAAEAFSLIRNIGGLL
jgi:N-acetylglucosamine malate deacetylase 1